MKNVCEKIILLTALALSYPLTAGEQITSIEQLEEKMEEVMLCGENTKTCPRFNCLETCLNLAEDPIDCAETCYLEVNASPKSFNSFLATRH